MSRRPHPSPCCLLPALAVAILAWSAAGCAPAAKPKEQPKAAAGGHDHDHGDHDHPETIAAGVAELESTAKDIATKLAAGSQEAADDALHAAGHLLEDLQGLLAKEKDLSAEAKDAGKKSLDELFECFDKLDTAMHAGADEAKTTVADVHASVKERIEAAVKSLKETFSKEAK
jgi:molecular chaperone GrpE (heat shock protein)